MTKSKLPPLNFEEDIEKYEAHDESSRIDFPVCKHKGATIVGRWLKCKCGVGWTAPASVLVELQKELNK